MIDLASFLSELQSLHFPNAFNPYIDVCDVNDFSTSPNIRSENLETMLRSIKPTLHSMWVGRDPGYRGARRTGIPLTDEFHLPIAAKRYVSGQFRKATKTEIIRERTATEVWQLLSATNDAPLMWNVFPLHPHTPGNFLSNRSHTRKERDAGVAFLDWLIRSFRPKLIIALGRDAYEAVNKLGYGACYVRHPSYGGQTEFRNALHSLYGTRTRRDKQKRLSF